MPALYIPFPNGVQVDLIFSLDTQIVTNRLWFWEAGDPPTSTNLLDLANGVYSWHTTYILPFLSYRLRLETVRATDWTTPPGPAEVTTSPPVNGGVVEESHSANVALSVRFRWANQYARQRTNKHFVPGIPITAVDLNTPTATFQDAMFEGYVALIDYARTIAPGFFWYWVTTSQVSGNLPRSEMLFGQTIGPYPRERLVLGQRRKRLPLS
jgi:hypothetical protein